MGDIVKLALRLFVFALVAAVALALTNEVTKGPIEKQKMAAKMEALNKVLPGCEYESGSLEGLDEGSLLDEIFVGKNSDGSTAGYAIMTNPNGYGGPIPITVGISVEGCVTQVYVGALQETAGLGTRVGEAEFMDKFIAIAADPDTLRTDVDTLAGATISSSAFLNAVEQVLSYSKNTLGIVPAAGDKEAILAAASANSGEETAPVVVTTAQYEATGFGPIKFEISIDDSGKIAAISVLEHNETPGFGADLLADTAVFGSLIGQDIASAQIDIKSGVTLTSNAINDALSQAASSGTTENSSTYEATGFGPIKFEIAVDDSGKIAAISVLEHNETPGFGADLLADTAVFESLIGQDIASAQIDVKSGVTLTSNAINDALSQAASQGNPSTDLPGDPYTVKGFSKFTVYIDVVDGKISSVIIPEHSETPGFGADLLADTAVFEALVGQDVASAQIDIKSGVTLTSNAVNEAIMQASKANGFQPMTLEEPQNGTGVPVETISEEPVKNETTESVYDVTGFQPFKLAISVDANGKIASVKCVENSETPGFGADILTDDALSVLIGQAIADASFDLKSGVTLTSTAINEALKSAASDFSPNTGSSVEEIICDVTGFQPFKLAISVDADGKIASVKCVENNETPGFGADILTDDALSVLVGQAIADASFDMKSGVTLTSTAINSALQNAAENIAH